MTIFFKWIVKANISLNYENCMEGNFNINTEYNFDVILTVHRRQYVEIKCQLDATEVCIADLIACSTCFGHHYAHHQELKSILQWLLPVVFGAVVSFIHSFIHVHVIYNRHLMGHRIWNKSNYVSN